MSTPGFAAPGQQPPHKFPSLFDLAVDACISHIDRFASFEGFPFVPFGQALVAGFERRANAWQISSEQREVGALLLAEAYGIEYLGPEYSGLRCSRLDDLPFLGAFSGCLAYLDLSGGRDFKDKDMASLASLSQLRVLDLSGLQIGDTGLSHLIRSVTFGTSGPRHLEYINLARTLVTDRGVARMFLNDRRLVFQELLGIDLSETTVHSEIALTLFQKQRLPSRAPEGINWTRLKRGELLFPVCTMEEQEKELEKSLGDTVDQGVVISGSSRASDPNGKSNRGVFLGATTCYYKESGSTKNPIQPWVDRLFYQYQSRTSRDRLSKPQENDRLGIAGVMALMKLSVVPFKPILNVQDNYQELEPVGHCSNTRRQEDEQESTPVSRNLRLESMRVGGSGKNPRLPSSDEERWKQAALDRRRQRQRQGTDSGWNAAMYQRVLISARETYGIRKRPRPSSAASSAGSNNAEITGEALGAETIGDEWQYGENPQKKSETDSYRAGQYPFTFLRSSEKPRACIKS
ncbi:hypothetical protein BGZ70_005284 [Mortierella alpina]|uniref:F-box/LRR-repeat protein 15-like leucin rich repeat domain-containing protein n=1 Tax=Mortierella alpina TaxID=64518 RepID=A0A9P6JGM9_MORAP|nr:hypothetical protein BGZ70_005284 [Mortierella alpina]